MFTNVSEELSVSFFRADIGVQPEDYTAQQTRNHNQNSHRRENFMSNIEPEIESRSSNQ
jgi:hypothetical protein